MFRTHLASQFLAAPPFEMNIHEYQAKQLFERFNIGTPKGAPAETSEEVERVAAGLNTSNLVVKAQIHAGGRGKGTRDPFETPVCRMTIVSDPDGNSICIHKRHVR